MRPITTDDVRSVVRVSVCWAGHTCSLNRSRCRLLAGSLMWAQGTFVLDLDDRVKIGRIYSQSLLFVKRLILVKFE